MINRAGSPNGLARLHVIASKRASPGLPTSLSRGKNGRRNKSERESCNTWQPGSLAGQDSVQSASFYKKPISNHMLRKDNDTTERGSAMFLTMADSSFDETVDNNPEIFENGSKARLLMNINEDAKYDKSLSLFCLLLFFPRERLVASPASPESWLKMYDRACAVSLHPRVAALFTYNTNLNSISANEPARLPGQPALI